MTKYEKITITYETSECTIESREFKNATFMFDSNYTSIVTKRNNFTIRTEMVISIECEEEVE